MLILVSSIYIVSDFYFTNFIFNLRRILSNNNLYDIISVNFKNNNNKRYLSTNSYDDNNEDKNDDDK